MKNHLIILSFFLSAGFVFSQEALKSDVEEYYDFLALQGLTERPALNYRTLSDSKWNIDPETDHPWKDNRLKSAYTFFEKIHLRVYGPELFMSFNTAAPYGQNDGALWQGKGFNTSFTAGARLEAYGIEMTFKPQLAFSQNMDFDIMPPANYDTGYDSPYGYFWAYKHNAGIDAPQRFGNKPFFTFDWGDTELRYTWKTLTIGFGTQAIWLGPAYLNPVLHSNNAPSYPKFDIGLRRQRVVIPWIDWYAGDIEARLWTGMLAESDYFDNDPDNDRAMIHGFSFAYAPSFLPGLTLSVDRTCLVSWDIKNLKYIFPSRANTTEDQKMSLGISWFFSQIGFEIFGEMGIDDFTPGSIPGYAKFPFHTAVFTTGLKKNINISSGKSIYGKIIFEFNWMEMTQDFQFQWPYSFYFHHNAVHGYTNGGQYLGNAVSPGGNSQYLGFLLYYPRGSTILSLSRNNPDNNFLYKNAVHESVQNKPLEKYINNYKANFNIGLDSKYFINTGLSISGGLLYNLIINPEYVRNGRKNIYSHNIVLQTLVSYTF
jgi:hypothetical protein